MGGLNVQEFKYPSGQSEAGIESNYPKNLDIFFSVVSP